MFENPKAEAFYAPRDCTVHIQSVWNVKIAVCGTPVAEASEPQVIKQDAVRVVRLGVKPWERDTSFIIDGTTNARHLTIGEAYITPGNWAGFPPHKHDVDNMPTEGGTGGSLLFPVRPAAGLWRAVPLHPRWRD